MSSQYGNFSITQPTTKIDGFDEYSYGIPKNSKYVCKIFSLFSSSDLRDFEILMTDVVRNRDKYFAVDVKEYQVMDNIYCKVAYFGRDEEENISNNGTSFKQAMKPLMDAIAESKGK